MKCPFASCTSCIKKLDTQTETHAIRRSPSYPFRRKEEIEGGLVSWDILIYREERLSKRRGFLSLECDSLKYLIVLEGGRKGRRMYGLLLLNMEEYVVKTFGKKSWEEIR